MLATAPLPAAEPRRPHLVSAGNRKESRPPQHVPIPLFEDLTKDFRQILADEHKAIAHDHGIAALHAGRMQEEGLPMVLQASEVRTRKPKGYAPRKVILSERGAHETSARWHEARATGQLERGASVENCGVGVLNLYCGCCRAPAGSIPLRCGVVRLCQACMMAKTFADRRDFALAREVIWEEAIRKGRVGPPAFRLPSGPYAERFVTLTAPHIVCETPEKTAKARITILLLAVAHVTRSMQAYFRKIKAKGCHFFRAFEWTPGADGYGHPHCHLWVFSPYIPRSPVDQRGKKSFRGGLQGWMAAGLALAGLTKPNGEPYEATELSLDIRRLFVQPKHIAREILKTRGRVSLATGALRLELRGEADGGLINYFQGWTLANAHEASPEILCAVYEALEGKRISQASRGFMAKGRAKAEILKNAAPACAECGEVCDPVPKPTKWKDVRFRLPDLERPPSPEPPPVVERAAQREDEPFDARAWCDRLHAGIENAQLTALEYREMRRRTGWKNVN